ncbi:MAG: stage II sporulation protein P [Clostridia bacterium]|nr:stage II sporulation protein P [Clostridia bacterium]
MKNRRIRLPVKTYLLIATLIISLSVYIASFPIKLDEKVAYIGAAFSFPNGFLSAVREISRSFMLRFNSDNKQLNQKDGNITDLESKRQFLDLSVTPDDIKENEEILRKKFNKNDYPQDGTITEKTYISYQASDYFENVFIRNVTVDSDIDVQGTLVNGCPLPVNDYTKPTVLIYHTHSTECYTPFDNGAFSTSFAERNNNKSLNMIRVGEELAEVLRARGIGVIHDTTIYDNVYTGAYDKSRKGITAILEKYPSIIITLDVHRDAIHYDNTTRVKPVAVIGNKKAAQMMILTGAEGGNVESFPSWETNLSFAVNLQKAVNDKYENLMKPMYFCNRKYNLDLTPYSLLIETGTDVNTLSEAAYSARLLGDVLAEFIKENAKEDKQ